LTVRLPIPGFKGDVIVPGDADYEVARLAGNAACDAHPALVARAADGADVAAVVRWARTTGQTLAVRSGGHSVAGHSTGDGLAVLDLGVLNGIGIDESGETAWVGPGVTAGAFTRAAFELGGAVSFGDTGTVGLGGLIPGGGIGWLVRKYGLTIDSLLAAEIVTADGELHTIGAERDADLFWAIRGGGGNFGVVTRYRLALNPIGEVLHGMLLIPATAETLRDVLLFGYRAPGDLTLMPYVMAIPPMDEVPASEHGRLGLWVDTLWAGYKDEGQAVLGSLRAIAPALMDDIKPKPYPAVYREPSGQRSPWTSSSIYLDDVDDRVFDTVAEALSKAPPGDNLAILRVLGGAASRVPNDATAYGWRDRRFLVWLVADYPGVEGADAASYAAWAREARSSLNSLGSGAFVNFMGADDPQSVAACYPTDTFARLREIKRRWDPHNLFRHNHNIPPADA